MQIHVEETDENLMKAPENHSPEGKKLASTTNSGIRPPLEGDGSWESIKRALDEFDKLNIRRRTHDEIIRELREFREP